MSPFPSLVSTSMPSAARTTSLPAFLLVWRFEGNVELELHCRDDFELGKLCRREFNDAVAKVPLNRRAMTMVLEPLRAWRHYYESEPPILPQWEKPLVSWPHLVLKEKSNLRRAARSLPLLKAKDVVSISSKLKITTSWFDKSARYLFILQLTCDIVNRPKTQQCCVMKRSQCISSIQFWTSHSNIN